MLLSIGAIRNKIINFPTEFSHSAPSPDWQAGQRCLPPCVGFKRRFAPNNFRHLLGKDPRNLCHTHTLTLAQTPKLDLAPTERGRRFFTTRGDNFQNNTHCGWLGGWPTTERRLSFGRAHTPFLYFFLFFLHPVGRQIRKAAIFSDDVARTLSLRRWLPLFLSFPEIRNRSGTET